MPRPGRVCPQPVAHHNDRGQGRSGGERIAENPGRIRVHDRGRSLAARVHRERADDDRGRPRSARLVGLPLLEEHRAVGGIADPTSDEAEMLLDVAAGQPPYEARLWSYLRTPAWFERFDADGHIVNWLREGVETQNRALDIMASVAKTSPDLVALVLSQVRDELSYPKWLRWVVRFAELNDSKSLFELFLDVCARGQYDGFEHELRLSVHNLAEEHPAWAVEFLVAYLIDRPGALQKNDRGEVMALKSREYQGTDLVRKAAAGAPSQFCDALLTYLLKVMEVTALEHDTQGLLQDAHFSVRFPGFETGAELGDSLFAGMASAIRSLVTANPAGMRPTLELLAADPHENAQWLLYQGLIAGGAAYADWGAELLLEGTRRLFCGDISDSTKGKVS